MGEKTGDERDAAGGEGLGRRVRNKPAKGADTQYNPSTREAKVGGWLKFEVSLGCRVSSRPGRPVRGTQGDFSLKVQAKNKPEVRSAFKP